MNFENTEVWGFKHAMRGMRNPMNSGDKSDSYLGCAEFGICEKCLHYCEYEVCQIYDPYFVLGESDLNLAKRLIKSGTEHRKFLRQIMVSVDITAPLYWWKEFDTYKISTTANSQSTMHKLANTPITDECFEMDDFPTYEECCELENTEGGYYFSADDLINCMACTIEICEQLRLAYIKSKDKRYWKQLIRLLPSSWLQMRTITMNYENLLNMYHQRKNHKLTEWSNSFVEWVSKLPYADVFIIGMTLEE